MNIAADRVGGKVKLALALGYERTAIHKAVRAGSVYNLRKIVALIMEKKI
jgi:hypothetical protein